MLHSLRQFQQSDIDCHYCLSLSFRIGINFREKRRIADSDKLSQYKMQIDNIEYPI